MNQHLVGSGVHPIEGDITSEPCILLNVHRLCAATDIPPLWDLWSQTYPEEPMTVAGIAPVLNEALRCTPWVNPLIPDNKEDILSDLRAMGRKELADRILKHLDPYRSS